MSQLYRKGMIVLIFCLGIYFCLNNKSRDLIEGFSTSNCPNLLIKKDGRYYLRNTKKAMVPGVNPISFETLAEYVEFTKWQRGQGIRCPVLFAQETEDAQGQTSYRIHPDVVDTNAGLPPAVENESLLYDAGRDQPVYNKNNMPAYDPMGQYIGLDTPLDKMFKETAGGPSANAMNTNWGGEEFSRNVVDRGAYLERTRAETVDKLEPNKVRGELY